MSLNDGSKEVENGESLIYLAVNSSCTPQRHNSDSDGCSRSHVHNGA